MPPGASGSPAPSEAARGAGEKRIPLASVTCVRMHSKLKYEFELVCTSRSYRLRAPSAQALALWVTAISSEWLQLRNPPSQLAPPTPLIPHYADSACSAAHPTAMPGYGAGMAPAGIAAVSSIAPLESAHSQQRWAGAPAAAPAPSVPLAVYRESVM